MTGVAKAPPGAEEYLLRAIEAGRAGMRARLGGPFGAIVVGPDGTVIAEGCNRVTSSNDPTAHAEVVAIRAACSAVQSFQLNGSTLYASCEPCPMCLAAAYWARLDAIVYGASREDAAAAGFDDAFIYDEIARAPSDRRIPMWRAAEGPATQLLGEWTTMGDRTPY